MKKKFIYRGILVSGVTKEDALSKYNAVASGDATLYVADNVAFKSTASELPLSPTTGSFDLTERKDLLAKVDALPLKSTSGSEKPTAWHVVCSSGCHSHLLADSKELLKACFVCGQNLSTSGDNCETGEVESASGSDAGSDGAGSGSDSDENIAVSSSSYEAAKKLYLRRKTFKSTSAVAGCEYLVCNSCNAHVIKDADASLSSCPGCAGELSAPTAEQAKAAEADTTPPQDSDTPSTSDGASSGDNVEPSSDENSGDDLEGGDPVSSEPVNSDSDSDDGETAAVASSYDEAVAIYAEQKGSISASTRPQYLVCTSSQCGTHIVTDNARKLRKCPICLSATAPGELPTEDTVDNLEGNQAPDAATAPVENGVVATSEDLLQLDDNSASGSDAGASTDSDSGSASDADSEKVSDATTSQSSSQRIRRHRSTSNDTEALGESESLDSDEVSEPEGDDSTVSDSGSDVSDEIAGSDVAATPDADTTDESNLSITDDEGGEINPEQDVDALSYVAENADHEKLDVCFSTVAGAGAWTAFYDGKPVAMARVQDAGKNADLFASAAFGKALLATAKVAGVKKSLSELGFKGLVTKLSVSKEIKAAVDAQVSESRSAIATEQAEYQQRFQNALATAAIGINREFWTGVHNPVKMSLFDSMSAAGIRNPEVMIDRAYAQMHDTYLKILFAKANDIMGKPADVQESLSKTILEVNFRAVSSAGKNEDRLSSIGKEIESTSSSAPEVVSKSESSDSISEARARYLAGLGKHN